ncbi:dihydropteroate synthase [Devriesea agamarum]|uniref:dihydropteroate synthase n=1 Tax=Devriesea agamarum TaxID=472569 RepID=UPI000A89DF9C|nr:dihydropteroate synthase [Devriesea agamarum]
MIRKLVGHTAREELQQQAADLPVMRRRPKGPRGLPEALTHPEKTLVMGVLNITPDSFSDGGRYLNHEIALSRARELLEEGADIIDVGGESTRPGAARVDPDEERRRVLPVVKALAADGVVVSIDTMRADIAEDAVGAGALIVNDVSGGRADPQMGRTVATCRTSLGEPPVYVAMHWRGHSDVMTSLTEYQDVAADVAQELSESLNILRDSGVDTEYVVTDPGLGFAKTTEQTWDVLARLDHLEALGLPILIGASRKRFLAQLDVDRDAATAAVTTLVASRPVWAVRVHEVPSSVAAVAVATRLKASGYHIS